MNRQIVVVTLLMAVAAIATAYDYNDPVFNQILADDLVELHSSAFDDHHYRVRRDEEGHHPDKCRPPFRRRNMCCAQDSFDKMHEELKDLKRECFKMIVKNKEPRDGFDPFRCDKMEKHKKEMTCVFECVGQKGDVLDDEGNPKEAEFTAFVKETMSKESWFASIQDKVIPTCLDEAWNATANRDTSDTESCNPAAAKLGHCLFREIQLSCPVEQIKDQKACSRLRERIRRHNEFYPPPPPPQLLNDE